MATRSLRPVARSPKPCQACGSAVTTATRAPRASARNATSWPAQTPPTRATRVGLGAEEAHRHRALLPVGAEDQAGAEGRRSAAGPGRSGTRCASRSAAAPAARTGARCPLPSRRAAGVDDGAGRPLPVRCRGRRSAGPPARRRPWPRWPWPPLGRPNRPWWTRPPVPRWSPGALPRWPAAVRPSPAGAAQRRRRRCGLRMCRRRQPAADRRIRRGLAGGPACGPAVRPGPVARAAPAARPAPAARSGRPARRAR